MTHIRHGRVWLRVAEGLALGLYLGRVLAEASSYPVAIPSLLAMVVGGLAAGAALTFALMRLGADCWPFLLLGIYVFCPESSPGLAAGVGVGTLICMAVANASGSKSTHWWPEAVAAVAGFALYVATLSPGLLPADSGEFQLVGAVLGIAHPPGYPLYTLLAHAFTLLPLSNPAWELNLFSALLSALSLGVAARVVRQLTGSSSAALLTAGALGCSATFWVQATTTNIRSLTALLTVLLLGLALEWGRSRSPRLLLALGGTFGLAVGHHGSLAFLGPVLLVYLIAEDPLLLRQPNRWVGPIGAALASSLVLLYLPLRSLSGAPFDPAPIRSLAGFLDHVLARGFSGDMFYFTAPAEVGDRLGIWVQILVLQFGMVLLVAMIGAAILISLRRWRTALLLLGAVAVNSALAVTYRAPQTVEYLMPSYVSMALLLGYGVGLISGERRLAVARALVVAVLAIAIFSLGAENYPSLLALSQDDSTRSSGEALLHDAPSAALILANWHLATPLWYLQEVEGLRPDVEVQYVFPEGALPNEEVWLRRISEGLADGRPVIVTNRFGAYERSGYRFIPFHDAWLVLDTPLRALPNDLKAREVRFADEITLVGYTISQDTLHPGDTLQVRVYWRADRPMERDYSTFVQLVGPAGVVGQGDISHRSSEYLAGEICVDSYHVPLLLHTAPGSYALITGFYYPTEDGWERLESAEGDHALLAEVEVEPAEEAFATANSHHWRFEGGLFITGVDVDRGLPAQTRLYIHLQRRAPFRGCQDPACGGQGTSLWLSADDAVLAEVALPTLKAGECAIVAVDLPEGTKTAHLGMVDALGEPLQFLGPWNLPNSQEPLVEIPAHGARYVPLGGEIAYLGEEFSRGDGEVCVEPRFLALRPLTQDYSVSAGLLAPSSGWEIKSDGTPALGAIPTLKWLSGWQVRDPHRLVLPATVPVGPLRSAVTIYDAFTLEPLNVLDERLAREGQGITVLGAECPAS